MKRYAYRVLRLYDTNAQVHTDLKTTKIEINLLEKRVEFQNENEWRILYVSGMRSFIKQA